MLTVHFVGKNYLELLNTVHIKNYLSGANHVKKKLNLIKRAIRAIVLYNDSFVLYKG